MGGSPGFLEPALASELSGCRSPKGSCKPSWVRTLCCCLPQQQKQGFFVVYFVTKLKFSLALMILLIDNKPHRLELQPASSYLPQLSERRGEGKKGSSISKNLRYYPCYPCTWYTKDDIIYALHHTSAWVFWYALLYRWWVRVLERLACSQK